MLNRIILLCCNQVFATSILYFTMMDPLNEIAKTLISSKLTNDNSMIGSVLADTTQNYYETLGVQRDATKHEIHKAFRQMAKKYHPDKNKDKSAQDEFIKVFKAYETLSDEKKRKDYDDQLKGKNYNQQNAGGWQHTTNMNDFDINDFFKQYEDQFLRHAQHFGHHNQQHKDHHFDSHHNKFTFHGVNLDDLFHDIDEDEYNSFDHFFDMSGHSRFHNVDHSHHQPEVVESFFGDGASYFGSHFTHQIHDTLHQFQHRQAHNHQPNYASCQTTTKQVNGMIMTQTSCT